MIVFNDRISLAREGSSRFVLRSFATKGENQRRRKRKKQKDPPPRRNGDQLFPPEDPLNMHETIAYLMQLAERDLLPFLFLSICLLFLFSPVSLSRVSRAGFKTLSLSRSLSLFFPLSLSLFLSSGNEWWKTCSNQSAFVISAGKRHRCKLHFE